MATEAKISLIDIAIAVLGLLLIVLVVKINGSTGLGRIESLNQQINDRQIEVDTYVQRNYLMSEQIKTLKTDEEQIEILARYHFGMIKPNEIFIQTNK